MPSKAFHFMTSAFFKPFAETYTARPSNNLVDVLSFVRIVQVVRRLVMERTYDRKVKERPLAFQRPPPPKAEVERKAHLASS